MHRSLDYTQLDELDDYVNSQRQMIKKIGGKK